MNLTHLTPTLRFAQPLKLRSEPPQGITRPFLGTPLLPAQHDMLLLSTHPDLLPATESSPARDLTFFNLDFP